MLPKNHNEYVLVKVCMNIGTSKKYACKNVDHKGDDSMIWTLERKEVFYVSCYDQDHRNVSLSDAYVIYYIHDNKQFYLHIEDDDYKVVEGSDNYNRHILVIHQDGKVKYYKHDVNVELC